MESQKKFPFFFTQLLVTVEMLQHRLFVNVLVTGLNEYPVCPKKLTVHPFFVTGWYSAFASTRVVCWMIGKAREAFVQC